MLEGMSGCSGSVSRPACPYHGGVSFPNLALHLCFGLLLRARLMGAGVSWLSGSGLSLSLRRGQFFQPHSGFDMKELFVGAQGLPLI